MKLPAVYIMASQKNGTLYTGVTSDLIKRGYQHKAGEIEGFTSNYDCKILVWFERHETMEIAILREKQIKKGSRKKKLLLIESENPNWNDLYEGLV